MYRLATSGSSDGTCSTRTLDISQFRFCPRAERNLLVSLYVDRAQKNIERFPRSKEQLPEAVSHHFTKVGGGLVVISMPV